MVKQLFFMGFLVFGMENLHARNLDDVECVLQEGLFLQYENTYWFEFWKSDQVNETAVQELLPLDECLAHQYEHLENTEAKGTQVSCNINSVTGLGAKLSKSSDVINVENRYDNSKFTNLNSCFSEIRRMISKQTIKSQEKFAAGRINSPIKHKTSINFFVEAIEFDIFTVSENDSKAYRGRIKKDLDSVDFSQALSIR